MCLRETGLTAQGLEGLISSHPHPLPCLSGFPFMSQFQHSLQRQDLKFACRSFLIIKMLQDVVGRTEWLTSEALKGPSWSWPHFSRWRGIRALSFRKATLTSSSARGSRKWPCDPGGDVLWSTWRSKLTEVGWAARDSRGWRVWTLQILAHVFHPGLSSSNDQRWTQGNGEDIYLPHHQHDWKVDSHVLDLFLYLQPVKLLGFSPTGMCLQHRSS